MVNLRKTAKKLPPLPLFILDSPLPFNKLQFKETFILYRGDPKCLLKKKKIAENKTKELTACLPALQMKPTPSPSSPIGRPYSLVCFPAAGYSHIQRNAPHSSLTVTALSLFLLIIE